MRHRLDARLPDRAWRLAGPAVQVRTALALLSFETHGVSQASRGVTSPHPDGVRHLGGREEFSSPEGPAVTDRDDASPLAPDPAVPPSPEVAVRPRSLVTLMVYWLAGEHVRLLCGNGQVSSQSQRLRPAVHPKPCRRSEEHTSELQSH